jgi:predicted Zn-dependent protease
LSILGCQATGKLAERGLGELVGEEKAKSIMTVAEAARKGFEDLTPQEEYYIGRAVAANVLQRYTVMDQEALTQYINKVGLAVAWASDRPETFGGYHYLVLDTKDPLAYSAPGGFIFISRGLIGFMNTEEELSCVLAHEVAHVSKKHGLSAIKQSRLMDAFGILVAEGKKYSSDEIQKLATIYEGALDDIVTMLIEKGYSRQQEGEADQFGVRYAAQAGYDPRGLTAFLDTLSIREGKSSQVGLVKSHPDPADRATALKRYLHEQGIGGQADPVRTTRFESMKKRASAG